MSSADEVPEQSVFKRSCTREWTPERVAQLSAQDIKQLRANAERLNESDLAALCDEVLKSAQHAQAAPLREAHTVRGVDAETVIHFQVQLRGAEYWAVWGKRPRPGEGAKIRV
jgi:hypothetical protein